MADRRKPRLLSLDGGGARGWTQLVLLGQVVNLIMQQVNKDLTKDDLEDDNIFPCDYFDLITGSGTGGINAIMIGRLGMSIKQCHDAWEALRQALQVQNTSGPKLLDVQKLEQWAKDLVGTYTGNENTKMLVSKEEHEREKNKEHRCKVSVTAMRAQNIGMSTLFRSYRVRANQEYNCCIWEAIRATTASPLLYPPIKIGRSWSQQEFINAELGANNPISYLIEEKQKVWLRQGNWPAPDIGCIVSIGSGKGSLISMPNPNQSSGIASTVMKIVWRSEPASGEREGQLYDVMLRIAKDCERKHQQIRESYGRDEEQVYFRFNIEHGMQEVREDAYDEVTRHAMQTSAQDFIDHAEYEIDFENVVRKLVELTPRDPVAEGSGSPDATGLPPYSRTPETRPGEKSRYMGPSNP